MPDADIGEGAELAQIAEVDPNIVAPNRNTNNDRRINRHSAGSITVHSTGITTGTHTIKPAPGASL